MSAEIDFKALWNKEEAKDMPDTKELLRRADRVRKLTRIKLITQTLVLLATIAVLLSVGFNIDHEQLTTIIGLVFMVVAIISYLIVANQLLPMLFKSNMVGSSQEYLNQLIRIKRKNEFINKVMINIYFSLLSLGVFLYSLQFVARMSTAWATFYYVMVFGWMAFSWFVSRPRGVKKKQKPLNEMIEKLESLNKQLGEE